MLYGTASHTSRYLILSGSSPGLRIKHQLIFRQFVSDVEVVTPDSNGRILIPKRYLQICNIRGDIRFIGIDNKIEIWAKERAEQPFMSPEEFGAALEEIMNDENRQDGER